MFKRTFIITTLMGLLSACGSSEKSSTVDVENLSYHLSMLMGTAPKYDNSGIIIGDLILGPTGLILSDGDRFEILSDEGVVIRASNYKNSFGGATVCCTLYGTEIPLSIPYEADLELKARFVRNSEEVDTFKLLVPAVPKFNDIAEPDYTYSLVSGQEIVISWQPTINNFSSIDFTRLYPKEDSECLANTALTYAIAPDQTSLSIPIENPELCAEQFKLSLRGFVVETEQKQIETELNHAPVVYSIEHRVDLDLVVAVK